MLPYFKCNNAKYELVALFSSVGKNNFIIAFITLSDCNMFIFNYKQHD